MISNTLSKHTITALVQDKPGVLNRISSMFRRRGFNISSLAVGQSESETLSRMTGYKTSSQIDRRNKSY